MKRTITSLAVEGVIASMRPAVVVNAFNPLVIDERSARKVASGSSIAELAPKTPIPFIGTVNGEPVLRADWGWRVQPGDIIAFIPARAPQGGGGSNPLRAILQIALVIAAAAIVGPMGLGLTGFGALAAQAAIVFVGTALLNAILPAASKPAMGGIAQAPSSTRSRDRRPRARPRRCK